MADKTLEKMESTAVVVKQAKLTVMSPMDLAKVFLQSGFFKDTQDISQATVKIMMGAELGMTPMASMMGIHIVQGKPMLSYTTVAALIDKHPRYAYKCLTRTDTKCEIQFFKDGEPSGPPVTFSLEDAKRAGTQNLAKIPSTMLFARALTQGARAYCAEVFGGCPIYDEGEIPETQERPALPTKGVQSVLDRVSSVDPSQDEPYVPEEFAGDDDKVSALTPEEMSRLEEIRNGAGEGLFPE